MFDDNKTITGGMLVEAVKTNNTGVTENDLNVDNIHWKLADNTGTAIAHGAGNYTGDVPLTFQLKPDDAHRPAADQKLTKKK